MNIKNILISLISIVFLLSCSKTEEDGSKVNSSIFFHPDGMGLNSWSVVRLCKSGIDGILNFDKIKNTYTYRGHMKNAISATSHGAATSHAYGKRVHFNSYGMDGSKKIKKKNVLEIAKEKGKSTGIINTGTITEPGTGAFIAKVKSRGMHDDIVNQIINFEPEVILGGGEQYFLPKGVMGYHGPGVRKDNKNIISLAKNKGYTIVYTKEQLLNLPNNTKKILGLFSSYHTFNDRSEQYFKDNPELKMFKDGSPNIKEMIESSLKILSKNKKGFVLIAEEEATDNFSNALNVEGFITAGIRADNAIGMMMEYIDKNKNINLFIASDSDAGGMQVSKKPILKDYSPPVNWCKNSFYTNWVGKHDFLGGVIAKSYGKVGSIPPLIDNINIYNLLQNN